MSVTVTNPNGKTSTVTGATAANGQAFYQYKVNTVAMSGLYNVTAVATETGFIPGISSSDFIVT